MITRTRLLAILLVASVLPACVQKDKIHTVRVSVTEQKMVVYRYEEPIATYPVSTSKFGLGDRPRSNYTPLGSMEIAKKIGAGAPVGMKFKSRKPTGEIVPVNAPGRDPIVTRILWLKGLEDQNRRAYDRTIYIHGTPEESKIGTRASYGCVRMRSADIVNLFNTVGVGAKVEIRNGPLPPPPAPTQMAAVATPAPSTVTR